ncbi:MAG: lipoate--protein ligase family protein [Geobacteraceae bacterium]|nr:lipoate--protein ligase family protein [Geobacteraceae bacterium]
MAIDEALLSCFDPEESMPVLRLYGWSPPAFSCGRFQKPEEILNMDLCNRGGVQVVKRITGGGVIYHANELTYSLVCPTDLLPGGHNVKEAFFYLTSFLLAFYKKLGLDAVYAAEHFPENKRLGERTPLCFAGVESCDILINGKKIGGNAQRRLKKVLFQHGSIPLVQMADKGDRYLLHPETNITERTTALEELELDRKVLASALATAFAESFQVTLKADELSAEELESAKAHIQKTA